MPINMADLAVGDTVFFSSGGKKATINWISYDEEEGEWDVELSQDWDGEENFNTQYTNDGQFVDGAEHERDIVRYIKKKAAEKLSAVTTEDIDNFLYGGE